MSDIIRQRVRIFFANGGRLTNSGLLVREVPFPSFAKRVRRALMNCPEGRKQIQELASLHGKGILDDAGRNSI